MNANYSNALKTLLVAASLLFPVAVLSDDSTAERSAAEVRELFKGVVEAQLRYASVQEIAHMEDAENIMVVGAGEPTAEHGIPEAIGGILKWHKIRDAAGPQICTHKLMEPVTASDTILSAFLLVTCKPRTPSAAKDTHARLLITLQKLPQGWRIVQEMWALGTF